MDQSASVQMLSDREVGKVGDAHAFQREVDASFEVVANNRGRQLKILGDFAFFEWPNLKLARLWKTKLNAIVSRQVTGFLGRAPSRKIVRGAYQHHAERAETSRGQSRIRYVARSDNSVESFLDHVNLA